MKIKKAVVVHCEESNSQAIYVDGVFVDHDDTMYAHDITKAVGGSNVPFTLEQQNIQSFGEEWPVSLAELEKQVSSS